MTVVLVTVFLYFVDDTEVPTNVMSPEVPTNVTSSFISPDSVDTSGGLYRPLPDQCGKCIFYQRPY